MKLNEIIEFRKELYFEGAVQIDWFYDPDKSRKVAENFVFHGSEYFGVENTGLNKRIDTISLTYELLSKTGNDSCNPLSLAISDYGTGKSHLAVTLGHLFSGPEYCPDSYRAIIENIAAIDKKKALEIETLSKKKNLVIVINGMKDFNLHSELLKATQKSLQMYGISDDKLRKINKSIEIAELFFSRNADNSISLFENQAKKMGWKESGKELIERINNDLLVDPTVFELINAVYEEINGHRIRWDEDISAAAILDQLVNEYCGINGLFDSVVILFDEFGRYLEYASGIDSARSGESALQQIFECSQNAEGKLHVINFIQSDIKSYLQRVDNTKNISRYIGRYDVSDKYYISSNLETVFANLIRRKNEDLFEKELIAGLDSREEYWKDIFNSLNKWKTLNGVWANYSLFRKVIVEGIYPMHPISTFMLAKLSDYLQNRSSLMMVSHYINSSGDKDIDGGRFMILPEELMKGDLYTEMLSSEQEGRQTSQHCLRYNNILSKYEDKLSDEALAILRSNLVLRIMRFKTDSIDEVKSALIFCSGLKIDVINQELDILTNEYGILGYDDRANCFDFMEESNGAHDFKIIKKRLLSNAEFDYSLLTNNEVLDMGDFLTNIDTQFGTNKHISTKEWEFKQELYPIEEISDDLVNKSISDWKAAIQPEVPKGKIIWLYVNKNTATHYIDEACKKCSLVDGKPIVFMLLNDSDNHLFNDLLEYQVLKDLDEATKQRYARHYDDDVNQNKTRINTDFINLKKDRNRLMENGIVQLNDRLTRSLTYVFESIYPNAISFPFDGFVSEKYNISRNQAKTFISIIRALLSGEVNDAVIHNWPIDTRNRFSALFDIEARNSWKCFSDQSHIVPPEDKDVRSLFEMITQQLEKDDELNCSAILSILTMPPFGLNYYAVVTLVCLVISNLSYCTRIIYNEEIYTSQAWRDLLLVKDDKTNLSVFSESKLKHIDADEVSAKFNLFFNQIASNKDADKVAMFDEQLKRLLQENELPDELEGRYNLICKIINDGYNAKNDFYRLYNSICEDKNKVNPKDLYPAVRIINEIANADFKNVFEKYNYTYSETYNSQVTSVLYDMNFYIEENFNEFLTTIRCTKIEQLNTFRNHTKRLVEMFNDAGFKNYAEQIKKQATQELENIELIKSRTSFRDDYYEFYRKCNITKYTSFSQLNTWKKECAELIRRYNMFSDTLKDAPKIKSGLVEKRDMISNEINNVTKEIGDIFDQAFELESIKDIDDLRVRINNSLMRGLEKQDEESLTELLSDLDVLKNDVHKIESLILNREEFEMCCEELAKEYEDKDSDILSLDYIERFINYYKNEMSSIESEWIKSNLTLKEKTDSDIYTWKQTLQNLPKYLSNETLLKIKDLDNIANELLKERRVETAIHYYDALNDEEKTIFLTKIGIQKKQNG